MDHHEQSLDGKARVGRWPDAVGQRDDGVPIVEPKLGIDVVTYERGYVKGTVFFGRGQTASRYDTRELWADFRERPLDKKPLRWQPAGRE